MHAHCPFSRVYLPCCSDAMTPQDPLLGTDDQLQDTRLNNCARRVSGHCLRV